MQDVTNPSRAPTQHGLHASSYALVLCNVADFQNCFNAVSTACTPVHMPWSYVMSLIFKIASTLWILQNAAPEKLAWRARLCLVASAHRMRCMQTTPENFGLEALQTLSRGVVGEPSWSTNPTLQPSSRAGGGCLCAVCLSVGSCFFLMSFEKPSPPFLRLVSLRHETPTHVPG